MKTNEVAANMSLKGLNAEKLVPFLSYHTWQGDILSILFFVVNGSF